MARRRIHHEEHQNHERWLVSYADFITLLFAFFVVMYSISQVNESKYRVLSNTLTDVFAKPARDLNPIQVGQVSRSNATSVVKLPEQPVQAPHPELQKQPAAAGQSSQPIDKSATAPDLQVLSDRIQHALGDLIARQLVTVRGNETWLEITLRSSLLFASGEADISEQAYGTLAQIAAILREQNHPVRVEGFTDDVPIHTARFHSNWELSSARAAAVVQVLIGKGMDPNQLMAAGFGQYHPIGTNATPEGRAKNRRVVLMVARGGTLRPTLTPETPALAPPATPVATPPAAPSQDL